jgi:hypothetical protein
MMQVWSIRSIVNIRLVELNQSRCHFLKEPGGSGSTQSLELVNEVHLVVKS